MQTHHLRPVIIGLLLLFSVPSMCQSAITSGGGTLVTDSEILSYSIGQSFYQIVTCSDYELSQGVQQAFVISSVLSNPSFENKVLVSVYPNPTTDYVTVQLDNAPANQLFAELKDSAGKLIYSTEIISKSSQIPFYSLSSGVYILSLNESDGIAKSFKIIKNR